MATSKVDGGLQVLGPVTCESVTPRSGEIAAARLVHRHNTTYEQANGADVASQTKAVYIAPFDGSVVNFDVFTSTAPTGGNRQFTVDLQKSTGGGAFATVLSSVVTMSSADANRAVEGGTINSASYAAGDVFQVVVVASGSTGSQGQGMAATVVFEESAA